MTQHEQFCQACGMPMSALMHKGAAINIVFTAATTTVTSNLGKRPFPVWRAFLIPGKRSAKRRHASGQNAT